MDQSIKELILCRHRGTNPDPTKFSNEDIKSALSNAVHEIACDYKSYRRNKTQLFEIMEEVFDEEIPKYVENVMSSFAEIKQVGNNVKATFTLKKGRQRAKQFITKAGLSGVYEAFRLDSDSFEVSASAIGGAAYIDWERSICGEEDISESLNLILEGIQEAILGEVQKALIASTNADTRPAANSFVGAGFDPDAFQKLINVAKVYGNGSAVVFAAPEFVGSMGPDAIAPAGANWGPTYSPKDIQSIADTGYVQSFRGTPIIQMPQSYTDTTNETTQVNPGFAYIFPSGGEKVVKVVLEGDTTIKEFDNRDNSMEIQAYKKLGVGILTHHNWCIYENTELSVDNTKYPSQTV